MFIIQELGSLERYVPDSHVPKVIVESNAVPLPTVLPVSVHVDF